MMGPLMPKMSRQAGFTGAHSATYCGEAFDVVHFGFGSKLATIL